MDEWQLIFEQVQSLTGNGQPLKQNLEKLIAFARSNPTVFDEPEYWNQVQNHDFQADFETLTNWAKQGLETLDQSTAWQFLLLDLGDCPETFRLYKPGGQELMSEPQFQKILSNTAIISPTDMENCFAPDTANPFAQLFGNGRVELCAHHVSELNDSLLDWTNSEGIDNVNSDFHGNNGYLLWLMLCSLALIVPLHDAAYCKAILQGHDKLHLLSGYEEIFFYAETITPNGFIHATMP